jgi:hypothetical protein
MQPDCLSNNFRPSGNLRVGFEGSTVLNRKDYGIITWNAPWRPAASSSATKSPSSSKSPQSKPPDLHNPNPGLPEEIAGAVTETPQTAYGTMTTGDVIAPTGRRPTARASVWPMLFDNATR